ncbi:MAG: 30S ribosomal protein S16 [Fimbriimonadaceae bacterium]|nr:30S ribosomal protein S16 [Chitinophagales bacterium]
MMVKMRLQRHGRKKSPFYHIVVANSTSPRDGKFIERLGYYNPTRVPAQITLDVDKALQWLQHGAEPTTTVNSILRYKGVLYKKHLLRGVKKGAFTMEVLEEKFAEWIRSHEGAVLDHVKSVEDKKLKVKDEELARIAAKRKEREEAAKKAADEAAKAEAKANEVSTEDAPEVSNEEAVAEITTEETVPDVTEETVPEVTTETPADETTKDQ